MSSGTAAPSPHPPWMAGSAHKGGAGAVASCMPARSPRWALMRLQMTRLHVARCLLCTCIRFRSGGAASRRGHSSQAANGRRWRPATSRKQQRCCPRPQVHQQRPSASKQRKLRRARTQEALALLWRIWTLDRACWMAAATAVTFNSNNKSPPLPNTSSPRNESATCSCATDSLLQVNQK